MGWRVAGWPVLTLATLRRPVLRLATLALPVLALATGGMTAKTAAAADTYGLVIGIDDYQHINPKLDGAVNDARDVADALRKAGARDVRLLLNRDAGRDAIMAAWRDLLGEARKGDTLVFHYAGHGGQEPEHIKGSEPTGYDSTLLLADFALTGQGTYERIVDDELGAMFKRVSDAGVNLLVAIDACHSGTMTRAFGNPAIAKPRVRAVAYLPISPAEDRLPPLDPAWAKIPAELPHVYYFGAVQDNEESPEVEIDGRWRGALSWSLAEGLRGAADANRDGVVTVEELRDYILDQIRMKLEGQQHPSVIPARARGVVLLQNRGFAFLTPQALEIIKTVSKDGIADFATLLLERALRDSPGTTASDKLDAILKAIRDKGNGNTAAAAPAPLGLAIVNAPDACLPGLKGALTGVTVVEPAVRPLLTWDVGKRRMLSALGDVVADFTSHPAGDDTRAYKRQASLPESGAEANGLADLPKVQGVVDKWHLTERIKKLAESRSLGMTLQPGDAVHGAGDKISFAIEGHGQAYFTLFDLASDGTVNFIYPLATAGVRDPLEIPLGRPYTVPLVVDAPYGADHLVAIASAEPLSELHKTLKAIENKPSARDLEAVLLKQLDGRVYQIGIHGSYTAEKR